MQFYNIQPTDDNVYETFIKNTIDRNGDVIKFIEILNKSTIKMRVWERGAGETLACGTGASASVVACMLNGLVDFNKEIKVKLLGGDLSIKWDKDVYMTGPAKMVFEGEYYD